LKYDRYRKHREKAMKKILRFIALLCVITLISTNVTVFAAPARSTIVRAGVSVRTTVASGEKVYYRYDPTYSDTYVITSTGNADAFLELYDENDNLLASDDDSGEDGNFSLIYPLTAGDTYYFCLSANSSGQATFYFRLDRNNEVMFSGRAGTGINWSLNAVTGALSLTGTGDMADYSIDDHAPWYEYRFFIKSVSVGSQIRSIGDHAFQYLSNVKSLIGGFGVREIGESAFARSGIETIGRLANLTSVGDRAFSYCRNLTSVDLTGVTSVGENCFEQCAALSDVTFGTGLTEIGDYAFNGCKALGNVVLSGNNTEIGDYAFSRSGVRNAELTGAVSIGKGAFYRCKSVEEIVIPATVKSVGARAFVSCVKLETVIFNGAAPKVKSARSDDRSFEGDVEMTYYTGRSGWTNGWQGYSVSSDRRAGDINNDKAVSNIDLIMVSRLIVGLADLPYNTLGAADYNGDGEISNIDVILIARHIVGI
jgi:hypothetical protein